MSSYQITVQPATEPITLVEAREHLKNEELTYDDDYVTGLIKVARRYCEQYTNRVFITQTWRQNLDFFPDVIQLKVNPIISLTSLKYFDTNESETTITDNADNFQKDFLSDVGSLHEGLTNSFPSVGNTINPIEIITVCGYGDASDVPDDIKHAIKLMVSHLYGNRDSVNVVVGGLTQQIELPNAVKHLLAHFRVLTFG